MQSETPIFLKNLETLYETHPQLADRLRAVRPPEDFHCVTSRSGTPTAVYRGKYLHSRMDPIKEARRVIERETEEGGLCIFEGFGLGYQLEVYREIRPKGSMIVFEPNLSLFVAALRIRDFSALFSSGYLSLILGEPPSALIALLDQSRIKEVNTIKLRSLIEIDQEAFSAMEKELKAFIHRTQVNTNTLNRFGTLWIRNLLRNIPYLESCRGIKDLQGLFAEIPVVLIAAGPSLDRLLPRIAELREHAVLVCVDTAYRALLRQGISPDFLVIVDPQYWNTRHLDRCPQKSLLISESSVFPSVFRQLNAPFRNTFLCSSFFPLGQHLEKLSGIKGKLAAGGSVATTAWDLARLFGASRIYTLGLDLGFPERRTHCRGSFFEERCHFQSLLLNSSEQQGFNALYGAAPYPVPDYQNNKILTDKRMEIYRSWFERQFADFPELETISLTPESVFLQGSRAEAPEILLSGPVHRPRIDARIEHLTENYLPPDQNRSQNLRSALVRLKEDLLLLAKTAARGEDSCSAYLDRREGSLESLLNKLNRVDQEIAASPGKDITGFLIQPILQKVLSLTAGADSKENSLAVSRTLYREIRRSAEVHLELIRDAGTRSLSLQK